MSASLGAEEFDAKDGKRLGLFSKNTPAVYFGSPAPTPRTLVDIFESSCQAYGEHLAIDDGLLKLSYSEVREYVLANAMLLSEHGIQPKQRIGVMQASGRAELYMAILVVLYLGCSYVPVDFDESDDRCAMIFSEANTDIIITQEGVVIGSKVVPMIPVSEVLSQKAQSGSRSLLFRPAPEDDAWVIFTSGSTGKPKAVAVTHRSGAALVDGEASTFLQSATLSVGDRVMAGLSVAFDASVEEMWLAWRNGACLVPVSRETVRGVIDLGSEIKSRRISVVSTVPSIASFFREEDLEDVRLLILGGEPCSNQLAEKLSKYISGDRSSGVVGRLSSVKVKEVWNTYGPTEATVIATAEKLALGKTVTIGLPMPGYDLAVVDENHNVISLGGEGELVISGVGVARYLDGEQDKKSFKEISCFPGRRSYLTGDIVRAEPFGLVYVGRRDDQVKISGRRIELGEIEECCRNLPGVLDVAAALKNTPENVQVLVAYLVGDGDQIDIKSCTEALETMLPVGCVPHLVQMENLPRRTSGKIDKSKLPWPLPIAGSANTYQADSENNPIYNKEYYDSKNPSSLAGQVGLLHDSKPIGEKDAGFVGKKPSDYMSTDDFVQEAWFKVVGEVPGEESNFFAAGGNSLGAARLVSLLRKRFPALAIADLYQHNNFSDLVGFLSLLDSEARENEKVYQPPRLFGIAQIALLMFLYTLVGMEWLLTLVIIESLFIHTGWVPHINLVLCVILWFLLMTPPVRAGLSVLFARIMTRSISPGKYRRGGLTHFRLWAATAFAARFAPANITGTPLINIYAKALGCKVGKDVLLQSMPPVTGLAQFADGVTVETEVDLSGWRLGVSEIEVGEIVVGENTRISTRSTLTPGINIAGETEILPGSCVIESISSSGIWGGSPARKLAEIKERWPKERPTGSSFWKAAFSFGPWLINFVTVLASVVPIVVLVFTSGISDAQSGFGAFRLELIWAPALVVIWILIYISVMAFMLRLLAFKAKDGFYQLYSRAGWRIWIYESLVGSAQRGLFPLYASLATPILFRLFGAKVGKNTEISTLWCLPAFCKLDGKTFLADDTKVGTAEYNLGWVALQETHLKETTFVGNSAIVRQGSQLDSDVLIGVMTLAPEKAPSGSSWLGNQALELPLLRANGDIKRTYNPTKKLVGARLFVEAWRLIVPVFSLTVLEGVGAALLDCYRHLSVWAACGLAGVILFTGGIVAALISILAKWILVGRIKPGEHLLWSGFVWRNELVDVFIEDLAVPWLIGPATGTPLLNWYMRALGAKIGRGVTCETYWLPEPDLIEIGEGSVINGGCVLQTHLFHDRILRLGKVRLGNYCSLGAHSIALPASALGNHCYIGDGSLVGRGEELPFGSNWQGNPLQTLRKGKANIPYSSENSFISR